MKALGRTDIRVSALALGTANFGSDWHGLKPIGEQAAATLLDLAADAGVNLLDTADVYGLGASEEMLGRLLARRRRRFLLATKVGGRLRPEDPGSGGLSARHILRALEDSLRRLRTDHVDLYMAHAPCEAVPIEETLEAFGRALLAGKARVVGCANFSAAQLQAALRAAGAGRPRLEFNQVPYSLANRSLETDLATFCAGAGVSLLAYSPLARGLLTDREIVDLRERRTRAELVGIPEDRLPPLLKVLRRVAESGGRSPGQAALGWLLAKPWVASAVVGVSDAAQLREDLAAAPLDPGQAALLDRASALCLDLPDGVQGALPRAEIHDTAHRAAGYDGRERILRTTLACNQRCPFCFIPRDGRAGDPAAVEAALEALARDPGPRRELILSGGEPTVDPGLPGIIASARRRGFRRFALQTNAVLLARPGLLRTLVATGVRTYMVSFHSHRPRRYDAITGSRGQFPRAVAGLTRLLRAGGCRVAVNVVVNALNYQDLPGIVGFLGRLSAGLPRRRRPGLIFSMLNAAGHERAPDWAVRLESAAPFLRRAVARCRRDGLRLHAFAGESAFPVCLLGDPGRLAPRRVFAQNHVRRVREWPERAAAAGRAKRPACRSCRFDARCLGVPAPYAARFGLAALRPLS